jgi:uncharacterized protein YdeI (BOF family)
MRALVVVLVLAIVGISVIGFVDAKSGNANDNAAQGQAQGNGQGDHGADSTLAPGQTGDNPSNGWPAPGQTCDGNPGQHQKPDDAPI